VLRPYQQQAINEIRTKYASGQKKILLHAPTGAGKTVVFCEILKAVKEKGSRALMVVRGRALVDQASKRLDQTGVEHGVLMAGHWRKRPSEAVQVCSIDTLYSRRLAPKADILIIDEAHMATSDGYKWLAEAYPSAYFLGVTATPYVSGSLRHVADEIVRPITIRELIAQNFLVPPVYYAPSVPDLTGVEISSTGDYVIDSLDKLLNQNHPIGDVVSSWIKLGEGRPTLLFAVSVRHSQSLAAAFCAAGVPAMAIDAKNSDAERKDAVQKLEAGHIKIICNVGIFCTGVDIPSASCLVMARPTLSYSLYIQQAGRCTRPAPGKKDFILIDHAGNVLRHGCILEERSGSLDPIQKNTLQKIDVGLKTCAGCFAVFLKNVFICPGCGEKSAPIVSSKNEKAMDPIEASMEVADPFHLKVVARRGELRDIAKRRGYKSGWVYYRLKEEFGETVADKYEKKKNVPDFIREKLRAAKQILSASSARS
jgi:superfamily II DNA or RNA helicase